MLLSFHLPWNMSYLIFQNSTCGKDHFAKRLPLTSHFGWSWVLFTQSARIPLLFLTDRMYTARIIKQLSFSCRNPICNFKIFWPSKRSEGETTEGKESLRRFCVSSYDKQQRNLESLWQATEENEPDGWILFHLRSSDMVNVCAKITASLRLHLCMCNYLKILLHSVHIYYVMHKT